MRKSFIAAAIATVAMGAAASSASALNVSPAGSITATSTAPYRLTALGGLINITCDVTLTGTIASSFSVPGHAGDITGGSVANCSNPVSLLVSSSNPWSIDAASGGPSLVTGTLSNAQFEVQGLPIVGTCLVRGNVNISIAGPTATTIRTAASTLGTSSCGITASDAGGQTFSLSPTQTLS
jgi:hypothetical protein